jgi:hypothetical protein
MRPAAFVILLLLCCGRLFGHTNPAPFLNEPLVPDSVKPGSKAFTLAVNGTGFVRGAVVKWNGGTRSTAFVSNSELQARILASDVSKTRTASVTVVNPAPGGGTSNVIKFEVRLPSPSVAFSRRAFNIGKDLVYSGCVGDFNGDGELDIAGMNYDRKEILIALGNGDGTFRVPIRTKIQLYGASPVTGDFNGDGKLDLALINSENTIAILLGNGDGTFRPQKNYLAGLYPGAIVVADFNGDGELDLAVSNGNDNTVSVLLGNGDGTFQPKIDYPTGGVVPGLMVAGDFNHDGNLDLAVNEGGSHEITIMFGNGDGSFSFFKDVFATVDAGMVAADLDGDGNLDLAIVNSDQLQVLYGKGSGDFEEPVTVASTEMHNVYYEWMSVADMIGHGEPGLFAFSGEYFDIVPNLGGRKFGTQFKHKVEPGQAPVAGDFNNDGMLDAILTTTARYDKFNTAYLQSPVVVSPSAVVFGAILIGSKSDPKTVTLTNSGVAPLKISHIKIVSGYYSADFAQTNNCPSTLASQASCKIKAAFTPSTVYAESAQVQIADNSPGGRRSIHLLGRGTVVQLSPLKLSFGSVPVGQHSQPQAVQFTNTSNSTVNIDQFYFKGTDSSAFSQTNTCGASVPPLGQCSINVTFSPTHPAGKQREWKPDFTTGMVIRRPFN